MSLAAKTYVDLYSFCWDTLTKVTETKFQSRLGVLAMAESFFRCTPDILTRMIPLIKVVYEKLDEVHVETEKPHEMAMYLKQLKALIDTVSATQ